MNKICTSLEQSQKLIELGIDIKTADICWSIDIPDLPTLLAYPITDCDYWKNKIPAWSLSALLNILHSKEKDIPSLSGGGYKDGKYTSDWCLDYEFDDGNYEKTFATNPVDACVEMIIKLKELKLL